MKRIIIFLFGFQIMQYKAGRKWIKGTFWHVNMNALCMGTFWMDSRPGYSQAKILDVEKYL